MSWGSKYTLFKKKKKYTLFHPDLQDPQELLVLEGMGQRQTSLTASQAEFLVSTVPGNNFSESAILDASAGSWPHQANGKAAQNGNMSMQGNPWQHVNTPLKVKSYRLPVTDDGLNPFTRVLSHQ